MKRKQRLALIAGLVVIAVAVGWLLLRMDTPDPFDVEAFLAYRVPDERNAAVHVRAAVKLTDRPGTTSCAT